MAEHEFRIRNRLAGQLARLDVPVVRGPLAETRVFTVGQSRGLRALVALLQGGWFVLAGLWPLVHAGSFEAVSGPKIDLWLARMAGAVLALLGTTLLFARARRRLGAEMVFLGLGSALVLAVADVLVAVSGSGTDAYLADAVLELVFAAAWALGCGIEARTWRVVTWNPDAGRHPPG
jgi:hypothetical protein